MNHDHLIDDVRKRQRNIAPEDTIRNDAVLEGFLIKGGRPLTTVQRIGAALCGFFFLSVAGIGLYFAFSVLFLEGSPPSPEWFVAVCLELLIIAGIGYLGVKMFWNGIRRTPRSAHRRRYR